MTKRIVVTGIGATSPIGGTVVRFRAKGSLGLPMFDLFQLQVLTPISGGRYSVRASSEVVQSNFGPGVQTFETALPIETGDLIGLHPVIAGGFIPIETVAGATTTQLGESTLGEPLETLNTFGYEVGLNADVQTLPTLTSIAPTSGPNSGGTSVVINGTGFEGVTEVNFGSEPAQSYTVESETKITAIAPANAVGGKVDVSVSTLAGPTAAGSAFFTYPAPPIVSSLSPAVGPTAGGTSVVISGVNFKEVSAVEFGGVAASGFTVDSASQITAVAPAHSPGSVALTVTTAGGTSSDVTAQFAYEAPAAQVTGGNGTTTPPAANPPPTVPTPPAAMCVVPKLKGKKLKAAKKAIVAADCKVGKVTKAKGVTAATGKTVKQSPKVGTSKAAGSKVNVSLG